MKTFFFFLVGAIIGYSLYHYNTGGSTASFNEAGKKIVIADCSKEQECMINIGNECKDLGYKILTRDFDNEKMLRVITAQCNDVKQKNIFNL